MRRGSLVPLAITGLLACSTTDEAQSPLTPAAAPFPAHFLFGSAIAGFQVDMGCPTLPAASCNDPNSDWYAFTTDPKTVSDPKTYLSGQPPTVGPGNWEL